MIHQGERGVSEAWGCRVVPLMGVGKTRREADFNGGREELVWVYFKFEIFTGYLCGNKAVGYTNLEFRGEERVLNISLWELHSNLASFWKIKIGT